MNIKFGPAGVNLEFAAVKNNKLIDYPKYLANLNLDALEYQCGRGVRIGEPAAQEFGAICKKHNIFLSIHSPYYISLSSIEIEKRKKSVEYILKTATIAKIMGAQRIVVHSGSCSKISRKQALELSSETLRQALLELKNYNLSDIIICPEVMGKTNQLGTVDEVIELCSQSENMLPCVDFGHLNARSFGALKSILDYKQVFDKIQNKLGSYRAQNIHIHFSKIEYFPPGGEKRHLTFEDKVFGPDFEPLADLLVQKSATPVIICESSGTQVEDAISMKNIYKKY
ncbi:MAG: TIM barrel protein, partial [Oscillospiraceae bacterium]|nr:TIM barrel protein [Oscillospiraceae bacterium]